MTDCPYMWPYCLQACFSPARMLMTPPLYHRSQPTMANVTIANGMGVTGRVSRVEWKPKGTEGKLLQVEVDYPDILWPWSGYLSVALRISKEGSGYEGVVSGDLQIQIQSDPCAGEVNPRSTDLSLQITVRVIPTPPREKRLLWDQFHSISYPSAYSPRDYLANEGDMLDRHGDHLHTNFKSLFQGLVAAGYYIEVLGSDCALFFCIHREAWPHSQPFLAKMGNFEDIVLLRPQHFTVDCNDALPDVLWSLTEVHPLWPPPAPLCWSPPQFSSVTRQNERIPGC
ncbi:unnamed protein product [Choristocarpus tenellus]